MERYEYIGSKYQLDGLNVEIHEFKDINGRLVVKTNKRTFVFNNFEDFLNNIKPYQQPKLHQMENKTTLTKESPYNNNNDQDEIKKLLFEAINKVKNDKSYVAQANAICNITTQLINIKKIELLNK